MQFANGPSLLLSSNPWPPSRFIKQGCLCTLQTAETANTAYLSAHQIPVEISNFKHQGDF